MGIANELITRGWHQGSIVGVDGSVCLFGAAICAAGLDLTEDGLLPATYYNALGRAVPDEGVSVWTRVITWNDDTERTFDEVLRAAKEADEILEGDEW